MEIVRAVGRHLFSALGGYLVAHGLLDANSAQELIGALLTILSLAASIYQKRQAK
jgi:hypothetical protein